MTSNIETIIFNETEQKDQTAEEMEILRQQAKAQYKEYKRLYNIKRYENKKEELKNKASQLYFKKSENPEYMQIMRDRANLHRLKKIKEQGKEPQTKKGRPKKIKEDQTETEKEIKKIGRPRKHF